MTLSAPSRPSLSCRELHPPICLTTHGLLDREAYDLTVVLAQRQSAMDRAYQRSPERFVHGAPRIAQLPTAVWINRAGDQTAVIRTPH